MGYSMNTVSNPAVKKPMISSASQSVATTSTATQSQVSSGTGAKVANSKAMSDALKIYEVYTNRGSGGTSAAMAKAGLSSSPQNVKAMNVLISGAIYGNGEFGNGVGVARMGAGNQNVAKNSTAKLDLKNSVKDQVSTVAGIFKGMGGDYNLQAMRNIPGFKEAMIAKYGPGGDKIPSNVENISTLIDMVADGKASFDDVKNVVSDMGKYTKAMNYVIPNGNTPSQYEKDLANIADGNFGAVVGTPADQAKEASGQFIGLSNVGTLTTGLATPDAYANRTQGRTGLDLGKITNLLAGVSAENLTSYLPNFTDMTQVNNGGQTNADVMAWIMQFLEQMGISSNTSSSGLLFQPQASANTAGMTA